MKEYTEENAKKEVKEYKAFLEEKDRKVAELTKNNKMKEQITPEQRRAINQLFPPHTDRDTGLDYEIVDALADRQLGAIKLMEDINANPSKYGLSTPVQSEQEVKEPYCHNYDEGITDERCDTHCGMAWCKPKEYDPLDCFYCGHHNNAAAEIISSLTKKLSPEQIIEEAEKAFPFENPDALDLGDDMSDFDKSQFDKQSGYIAARKHTGQGTPVKEEDTAYIPTLSKGYTCTLCHATVPEGVFHDCTLKEKKEWISVETPPKKSGLYLVFNPNLQKDKRDILRYDNYNNSWQYYGDTYHPSHWMPLPAPPKE